MNPLQHFHRRLLAWEDNDPVVNWVYVVICLLLTCMAGLMSGLTLGLLSLDSVELEVLLRSGTEKEKKYARKIIPIVSNSHLLLVTLLFCNALSMEALPLYLDKLADPVTAVLVSVTAVLFFGEIVPQSVCSRYGLRIGASLAPFVRLLMWLCSPVAWPMGKLLDLLLGHDHHTLFRRRQLKELVSIHAEDMGGTLTQDEIKVITGALDLTNKVAIRAMTPLDKVFMLSSADQLDEPTLRAVLRSGHSRIPVHRECDRSDVVGLVLVKELLQYRLGASEVVPVTMLRMRSIPRLPATTPMYDMLRLFQTGRSHIAVLTQPAPGVLQRLRALDPSIAGGGGRSNSGRHRTKGPYAASTANLDGAMGSDPVEPYSIGGSASGEFSGVRGVGGAGSAEAQERLLGGTATPTIDFAADDGRSVAAETEGGDTDAEAFVPYLRPSMGPSSSFTTSLFEAVDGTDVSSSGPAVRYGSAPHLGTEVPPPSFRPWVAIRGSTDSPTTREAAERERPPPVSRQPSSAFAAAAAQDVLVAAGGEAALPPPQQPQEQQPASLEPPALAPALLGVPSLSHFPSSAHRLARSSHDATSAVIPPSPSASNIAMASGETGGPYRGSLAAPAGRSGSVAGEGALGAELRASSAAAAAAATAAVADAATTAAATEGGTGNDPEVSGTGGGVVGSEVGEDPGEPEEGRPIGIITIEDVIEELIRSEIVDETDRFVDNDRKKAVNRAKLAAKLPEHLVKVLTMAGASKKAALQRVRSHSGGIGGLGMGLGGFGGAGGRRAAGWGQVSGAGTPREASYHSAYQPDVGVRVPLLAGDLWAE